VNYIQAGEIHRPNAPLARGPWACRRLYDATLAILKEIDPDLPHADLSHDGDKVGGGPIQGLTCLGWKELSMTRTLISGMT
jgi:hypothetical protein